MPAAGPHGPLVKVRDTRAEGEGMTVTRPDTVYVLEIAGRPIFIPGTVTP